VAGAVVGVVDTSAANWPARPVSIAGGGGFISVLRGRPCSCGRGYGDPPDRGSRGGQAGLVELQRRTGAEEIMLSTRTHSYEARARSLELVAEAWQMPSPRGRLTRCPDASDWRVARPAGRSDL